MDTSFIRLEKKYKINGLCGKRSARMMQEQVKELLSGSSEFLLDSDEPLFIELYSKIKGKGLWPKAIVRYDREAFLYAPGNVRITLDRDIRTGLGSVDFLNPEIFYMHTMEHCTILKSNTMRFCGACPHGGAGTRKAGCGLLQIRPEPAVRLNHLRRKGLMTFQDIFKSSFLENIASISILDMVIAMVLAFLLGLFIFFIYKKSYSGVMYSASFGVTLIALSLITTLLIMTVVSNIVLSLGMVGALSIVRFRTAIKEPMDIAFLFWAIAVGIVLAAGLIPLAVFGSIFIGVVLFAFSRKKTADFRISWWCTAKTARLRNRRGFLSNLRSGG